MIFPKTRRENLEWRASILRRCALDPAYREQTRELFHRNILFAFNAFLWTYDPRKRPEHHIPFMTWDYQDETILELEARLKSGGDFLVEKSRDMGATWIVLGVIYHEWASPIGGGDFLVGSRIEDYVDRRGDPRTHFWKVRYMHGKVPRWLWPKGFNKLKHDNFMRFINPATGASITGESNNPNFSTQGRFRAVLFDEFAKWENSDQAAWTAAGDATPCRIATSTPNGAAGQYYELVQEGKVPRKRLHWSLHPEKALGLGCVWPPPNEKDKEVLGDRWKPRESLSSPWYEREKLRRRPLEIAQELDINYLGAGNPIFDGAAGENLMLMMALEDNPVGFGTVNLAEMKIEISTIEPLDREGLLVVYESPQGRPLALGVDVVEGKEDGDFGVLVFLDRISKSVVAVYWSKEDEITLGKVVKAATDFFTPLEDSSKAPWVGIETTGPGLATFDYCVGLDMTNLFMAPRYDVTNGGVSYKKGWRTDVHSRNELVSGIRQYLQEGAGRLNSHRLVGECMTFTRSRTGKPEAKSGTFDDMVMAFGMALQVDQLAPQDWIEIRGLRVAELVDFQAAKRAKDAREALRIVEPTGLSERIFAHAVASQTTRMRVDELWEEY